MAITPEKRNSKLTFPNFDGVSDFSDHHFSSRNPPTSVGNSWHKAINKEWRILQENLPESIFVRVSETRSDLLRAAIIGAAGTPYQDFLFFFDIALTANFPNQPPKVYYHSRGNRVNPNLYSHGFVCLSLLNTWNGRRSERWNPKRSTLLQVLVSIQSLVLNEKPYFNEPGRLYLNNKKLLKLSEYYNQDVFLLTGKTTINLIKNPPSNFEPLIEQHFLQKANSILAACDAYANGRVMVGFYGCDKAATPSFELRDRFITNMEIVYNHLATEFRRIGARLPNAGERLVVPRKTPLISNKPKGFFRRMIKNIRAALGLKKKKNSDEKASSEEQEQISS